MLHFGANDLLPGTLPNAFFLFLAMVCKLLRVLRNIIPLPLDDSWNAINFQAKEFFFFFFFLMLRIFVHRFSHLGKIV